MKNKLLIFISVITVLFCVAIAFDVSPFLRGPAPYPPEWRWDYLFVNTMSKIWAPLLIIVPIIYLAYKTENSSDKKIVKHEQILLSLLIILFFLFQLAILYFSRAGIGVLLHRIINPDLNGYFTAAIGIKDLYVFINGYNDAVLTLPQHAQGHPPGAILFFYAIEQVIKPLSGLYGFIQHIHIKHSDVGMVWDGLTIAQKATALFSGLFIPFLSSLTLIPLYFTAKKLYSVRTAIRAAFLYLSIPSITLFIPINDVFLPLFVMSAFLLFLLGIKKEKKYYLLLAGIVFSLGLFFSLSLLPLLFIFLIYLVLQKISYKKFFIHGIYFSIGLLISPLLLYVLYDYNTLEVSKTLMSGLPEERSYVTWFFYNLYDFFIFSGIPVLVLFCMSLLFIVKSLYKTPKQVDAVSLGFIGMILILTISGSVRGEVARIWLPFYGFLVLGISYFITKKLHLTSLVFVTILCLQFFQVLVMQEFWVMLW